MSFGSTEMYTALNVSNITDEVDTYNSSPAIFDNSLIPQDFTDAKSINYYLTFPGDLPDIEIYTYTINCRANTMNESRVIAQAVIDNVSRVNGTNYLIYCTVDATIHPFDDRDNYNTPVTATIKLTN